ncbi:methyl-accepting chemotaxis protein [Aurantiacibacter gangjinensis]|uniref:Uncharacterized protein n=1 Tax=Aurantiacibacter gangjinensis TaxID=502682 RepID=A0A0G9MN95_9SPHN|nr:methyl-accepting chemotaxis protein [Aurantiacibacter gangjinensis]APE27398.1 Methyl-accepting chemotaxis protein [Aurantiacibacter gangjinensis]KLE32181.1 hypothetical protein AAW01_07820 [Aurantiacibacter gangjinensis]
MKHEKIEVAADPSLIDAVARSCGEVTVGCVDVGGLVEEIMTTAADMKERRQHLEQVIAELSNDQKRVTDASDEARLLSEHARDDLRNSTAFIRDSVDEFSDLTDLIVALSEHITGFAGAMEQVRRVSQTIDTIAETTNMLALNAAIEAHRAGDAGRTFAVVAQEVKKLAQDTRIATDEIASTVDSLGGEAETLVTKISTGVEKGKQAQQNFARVDETVNGISTFVDRIDEQNAGIAQSTAAIQSRVEEVRKALEDFADGSRQSGHNLEAVKTRVGELELLSMDMFDQLVRSGFAAADLEFVQIAMDGRDEMVARVEEALDAGTLTEEQVFDRDYREIPGSKPTRYDNSFTDFADRVVQPILDERIASRTEVLSCVASNQDGYLPTHNSERSQAPNGDPVHDDKYCRNRRIVLDSVTQAAIDKKDLPFSASCYRYVQTGDSKSLAGKNIFVPVYVKGKYWGNFEIFYLD